MKIIYLIFVTIVYVLFISSKGAVAEGDVETKLLRLMQKVVGISEMSSLPTLASAYEEYTDKEKNSVTSEKDTLNNFTKSLFETDDQDKLNELIDEYLVFCLKAQDEATNVYWKIIFQSESFSEYADLLVEKVNPNDSNKYDNLLSSAKRVECFWKARGEEREKLKKTSSLVDISRNSNGSLFVNPKRIGDDHERNQVHLVNKKNNSECSGKKSVASEGCFHYFSVLYKRLKCCFSSNNKSHPHINWKYKKPRGGYEKLRYSSF